MDSLTDEQQRLVEEHYGSVTRFVQRFRTTTNLCDADYDEIEQEAALGLMEAAKTYDPDRGSFATHVWWAMRTRLSAWMKDYLRRMKHTPLMVDVFTDEVKVLASVETPKIPDMDALQAILSGAQLTAREAEVLNRRLYYDESFAEIAQDLGITKQVPQKLYKNAIKKLRMQCRLLKMEDVEDFFGCL